MLQLKNPTARIIERIEEQIRLLEQDNIRNSFCDLWKIIENDKQIDRLKKELSLWKCTQPKDF